MSHNNLQNYYRTMFAMVHHHKFDGEWLENQIVFEKDIYTTMVLETISKNG